MDYDEKLLFLSPLDLQHAPAFQDQSLGHGITRWTRISDHAL